MCVDRKWLAHVVKVRSSVPLAFVCVRASMCVCVCGRGRSFLGPWSSCGQGAWSLPVVSWGSVTQRNQDTL